MERLPAPPLPDWISALLPPQIRRFSARVADLRLHVMEVGRPGPRPTVVMLHGNPTWGFLYRRVAAGLLDHHLIIPDLAGLGFSDKPRDPAWHRLDRHAELIGGLLRGLELGPVVFVGQDWGGPIGLLALAQGAAPVAGLVLMNTVIGPPLPGFRPTAFHRLSQLPVLSELAFRGLGLPQSVLALAQGDWRSIRGEVSRAYRYPLRKRADRAGPLGLARMVPNSLYHPSVGPLERCLHFVEDFRGPAALVWGERDPILGRLLRRTQRSLPQATVTATAAGHMLQEEVPEAIATAIRGVVAVAEAEAGAAVSGES